MFEILHQLSARPGSRWLACLLCCTPVAHADTFECDARAAASLDHYRLLTHETEASAEAEAEALDLFSWVVDTNKGWRRSDTPFFSGACESSDGYVVCRLRDRSYGEATFTIHPDGEKFSVVYVDYGLGALTFVGRCSSPVR